MKPNYIDILKKEFPSGEYLTKEGIADAFLRNGVDLSDTALRKRIFDLTENGLLQMSKRGVYTFKIKPSYNPLITPEILKTAKLFASHYPEINYCIWPTSWLHDFMIHQPFNYFIIFETEADMTESAFNLFKDNHLNAFIKPGEQIMKNYTVGPKRSFIVKKLIARSPVASLKNTHIPVIEKFLVDAFCDKDIFFFYQGAELVNIFSIALKKYNINFSLLLRYADVRSRKQELIKFLRTQVSISQKLLS